jgi:hypothetical protein
MQSQWRNCGYLAIIWDRGWVDLWMQTWFLGNLNARVDTEDVVCISGEEVTVTLEVFPVFVAERHLNKVDKKYTGAEMVRSCERAGQGE